MTAASIVLGTLTANGWDAEPTRFPAKVDARVSYTRPGTRLVLEHHAARQQLLLWIEAGEERRAIALTYGHRLDDVLAKLIALQETLSLETYLQQYGQLSLVCGTSIVAWEQFETAADRLSESYPVHLLYPEHLALDGDAIWSAFSARFPGAQRVGTQHFVHDHPSGPQAALAAVGAPDPTLLVAALGQTWSWDGAADAVEKAGFSVAVSDLQAGGVERDLRLSMFLGLLRAVLSVHPPLGVHWLPTQRIVDPQLVLGTEDPIALAYNVRFFPAGLREGEALMDTRGLEMFGLPDVECRWFELPPEFMASRVSTVARYLWQKGDIFTDPDSIDGLGGQPWPTRRGRATARPDRPILRLKAGPFTRD
jgi:hypothetical protein